MSKFDWIVFGVCWSLPVWCLVAKAVLDSRKRKAGLPDAR